MIEGVRVPFPAEPYGSHTTTRGAKWLLFARLAVALSIIVFLLVSQRGWGEEWPARIVYGAVTGAIALNALYLFLLRRVGNLDNFLRVQLGVDIFLEALMVFLTGGVDSQIVVLFLLTVMSAALALSWRDAVAFTAEAAVLHVLVTALGFTGLSPYRYVSARETLPTMFLQLFGMFAVALLSGILAHRLSVARLLSRDILDSIGQGLLIADSRGRILFSNDEAKRLLGEEAASTGNFLEGAFPASARRELQTDPLTGHATARHVEMDRPEGGKAPVSIAARAVYTEGERPAGTLVVITDRTLERRVEEAMMQAQRSEAVSEMSTAIAHEIRNPLAAIRSSVQEIGRRLTKISGEPPGDSKKLFDIVLSESDRLDAIVSDFLAFAKMPPVHKRPCSVDQVASETAVLLRQSVDSGEDVEIETQVEPPLRCRADPQKLRQVLLNVGLNGLQAVRGRAKRRIVIRGRPCALLDFPLGSGGGELARDASLGERSGVQIDVEDTGCGMTEETRRRAMDPFFTQKERGTGLGLAVVDRIVRSHGGMIRIESEPDKGTGVHIWIPTEE
jgi:two-component system sensor histidine kinase PilS (NtrC family)